MANTKGSLLPAMTIPVGTDILITVDDPGVTPATQKVTFANAWTNYFKTQADSFYSALGHSHAPGDITGGTFANGLIAQSNVTQHQAALSITESQISDLGSYITASSTETLTNKSIAASQITALPESLIIAASDETTALTTGTAKATFRMPFAMTLAEVRASVTTAPTGANLIVDINDGGATIMTTNKLSIDATEKTSETATTAHTLTDTALADDAEITIDIDQIGSTIAGAGLKVSLIGTRT